MKEVARKAYRLAITILLIPVSIIMLLAWILMLCILIPAGIIRVLVLGMAEVIISTFRGEKYEERVFNSMFHQKSSLIRATKAILLLPFISKHETSNRLPIIQYLDFERKIAFKNWLITGLVYYCLFYLGGMVLNGFVAWKSLQEQTKRMKYENTISHLKQSLAQDSLKFESFQDSLRNCRYRSTSNFNDHIRVREFASEMYDSLSQQNKIYFEYRFSNPDGVFRDSLLPEADSGVLKEELTKPAERNIEENQPKNSNQSSSKSTAETSESDIQGTVCFIASVGCDYGVTKVYINGQFARSTSFFNNGLSSFCGQTGTITLPFDKGVYNIKLIFESGEKVEQSIDVNEGSVNTMRIPC